ncbi:MAG: hypothetical protein JO046_06420 [Solirubrobacterales bacterium]|nr:hypothetical protein [Solirubrobacterales bacterium]MBV9681406.1 hypothetical protein [Solirubrobacterales bacterium]
MLTLLLAAGEPSKIPFYIAGGLLVLWALTLAAVGLTRPAFPTNGRGARGVMLVSVALALLAMAMAVITSAFPK